MTPRSLFNVVLKIFGLFFLREIINAIPQVFSTSFLYFGSSDMGATTIMIIISLLILALYSFLVIQLLFKTNKIIDLLQLDKGFEEKELSFDTKEEFSIGLSSTLVLTIALIVLGGVILVEEIPVLCRQLYFYFDQKNKGYNVMDTDFSYMVLSVAKILIGLLLLGERKRIVAFIESKKNANVDKEGAE